jgi:hypothetical protein
MMRLSHFFTSFAAWQSRADMGIPQTQAAGSLLHMQSSDPALDYLPGRVTS